MSNDNPYAPPQVPVFEATRSTPEGIWRQGRVLVMHKQARLPDRCVKSNEPAKRRLTRKLSWHNPLLAISILVNLLLYLVLALVFRETARIEVPLADAWFARRRRRILIAWLVGLTSFACFIAGFFLLETHFSIGIGAILGGIAVTLIVLIVGQSSIQMVHAKRITKEYVWLKGVCQEYLQLLPEWPNYAG